MVLLSQFHGVLQHVHGFRKEAFDVFPRSVGVCALKPVQASEVDGFGGSGTIERGSCPLHILVDQIEPHTGGIGQEALLQFMSRIVFPEHGSLELAVLVDQEGPDAGPFSMTGDTGAVRPGPSLDVGLFG